MIIGHYRLSVSTVSRRRRSAVAAAAYRSGTRLVDERTGRVHDYRKREHAIVGRQIVLPDDAAPWLQDRQRLWNEAERAERRRDARVAREVLVSLPASLPPQAQWELAMQLAAHLADGQGVAVDLAMHRPGWRGSEQNVHAHLLLTTRRTTPSGLGAKTRELDRARTSSGVVRDWRRVWAEMQNQALEAHHLLERVDHRRGAMQERRRRRDRARLALELLPSTGIAPRATRALERSHTPEF